MEEYKAQPIYVVTTDETSNHSIRKLKDIGMNIDKYESNASLMKIIGFPSEFECLEMLTVNQMNFIETIEDISMREVSEESKLLIGPNGDIAFSPDTTEMIDNNKSIVISCPGETVRMRNK